MCKGYNCMWCEHTSSKECGRIVSENFNSGARHVKKMDKRCFERKRDLELKYRNETRRKAK